MTNNSHHLLEATAPSTNNPLEDLGAIEHDNAEQATTITSSIEEMAPHELLESAMDQARHDANIHDLLQVSMECWNAFAAVDYDLVSESSKSLQKISFDFSYSK